MQLVAMIGTLINAVGSAPVDWLLLLQDAGKSDFQRAVESSPLWFALGLLATGVATGYGFWELLQRHLKKKIEEDAAPRAEKGLLSSRKLVTRREAARPRLLAKICEAKSEVTLVGGFSEEMLQPKGKKSLIKCLRDEVEVSITIESIEGLFRRAQYLELAHSIESRRAFETLLGKRQRILDLPDNLKTMAGDIATQQLSHLNIQDTHCPLPLTAAKVDDLILVNPAVHLRNSLTPATWLTDIRDPLHKFVCEYIDFHLTGRGTVWHVDDERFEMVEPEGRTVGWAGCDYPTSKSFGPRVVWTFLFDREGRLLIQKRSAQARDNLGLWDKSAGGHQRDEPPHSAAAREFKEELFNDGLPHPIRYIGKWASYAGQGTEDALHIWELAAMVHQSSRRSPTDERLEAVTVFALVAPEELAPFSPGPEVEQVRWVALEDLQSDIASYPNSYTPDLKYAASSLEPQLTSIVASIRNGGVWQAFAGDM